jgi:DNA repair exonuclease SbcCD nuclease subunit
VKFVLTSDFHHDAVTAGIRRDVEVEAAVDRSVAHAIEQKADAWCFLGDLCDPDSGAATIRAIEFSLYVARRLNAAEIRNYWVVGNHDVVEDGSSLTTLAPLKAADLPWTTVFDHPAGDRHWSQNFVIVGLPFVARGRAYDPAAFVKGLSPAAQYVFLSHLQLEGAKIGSETVDMPRGRDVAFPTEVVKLFPTSRSFSGHYHRRQVVGGVQVVGSPVRLTFSEEFNSPGFLVSEV